MSKLSACFFIARRTRGLLRRWPLAIILTLYTSFSAYAAAPDRGQQIYSQQCAKCHGPKGEGTAEHYPQELVGDKSVVELTKLITDTMPDGEPQACVGEDAAAVAAFIHQAFYSEIAHERNKPVRLEASRLTVRQYENAVADLFASFRGNPKWDQERGLRGEYFADKFPRQDKRVLERRDPTVNFQFGDQSPVPDGKIDPKKEYCAKWEGSLLVPDTGDYEFIVETENAARLWVNDSRTPLIDAGVKSGDQSVYRESIRLLGGRVYYMRLEMSKMKEPKASIALKWKPPHGAPEVIPARNLSPHWAPRAFVLATRFPPDDSSYGFERGTSVSREWDEATTYAAIEVSAEVVRNLPDLTGKGKDAAEQDKRTREFCRRFVERAFRRSLTPELQELFIDRRFKDVKSPEEAVERVVLLAMKSPRFLYRETNLTEFDDYATAAWLSFALWDSIPDQQLFDAAGRKQLNSKDQLTRQAQRMLSDLRAKSKLRAFLHQWLNTSRFTDVGKDEKEYPEFNDAMFADLRTSLDLFLDDVVWSGESDFRQLFLTDGLYVNGRLAAIYGVKLPADADFQRVALKPDERAGILSHPYLMTGFAYHSESSPIHRGVFLARSVLGRLLKPPPEAVAPVPAKLHAELTTRQRVEMQTKGNACQTCHAMINPLGFSLEHYDAIGRYRREENSRPIDATGSYFTREGDKETFRGVRALAEFLVDSEEVHEAFVEQMFSYMVKQPVRAFGPDTLANLEQAFDGQKFNIQKLVVEMTVSSALEARRIAQPAVANKTAAAGRPASAK